MRCRFLSNRAIHFLWDSSVWNWRKSHIFSSARSVWPAGLLKPGETSESRWLRICDSSQPKRAPANQFLAKKKARTNCANPKQHVGHGISKRFAWFTKKSYINMYCNLVLGTSVLVKMTSINLLCINKNIWNILDHHISICKQATPRIVFSPFFGSGLPTIFDQGETLGLQIWLRHDRETPVEAKWPDGLGVHKLQHRQQINFIQKVAFWKELNLSISHTIPCRIGLFA